MYWYGWTATVIVVGAIRCPCHAASRSVTRKIPLSLVWILPILTIPFFAYSLMSFWTHP